MFKTLYLLWDQFSTKIFYKDEADLTPHILYFINILLYINFDS